MRSVLLAVLPLVASCNLYWPSSQSPPPDAFLGDDDAPPRCAGPAPGANCACTDTIGWACNSCPFGEGSDPVACDTPGVGCELETWEHGCSCECGSDGWWSCMPETVGSTCPTAPAECTTIEAEGVVDRGDWALLYGDSLSGGEGLTATSGSGALVVPFNGYGLAVQVEEGATAGILSVQIDGGAPIVITTNTGDAVDAFYLVEITSALVDGPHTAVVTCPELTCSIDYFAPECSPGL